MKKVLVVDDDEDIVNIVSALLQAEGYHTVTAQNGKDALTKAASEKPDLIIADIMMPEMDGWEFCWRVREDKSLGETPFIFLTARADVMDQIRGSEIGADVMDQIRGSEIGADDYIIKPFRKQELLKRVQNTFDVIELLRKVKTQGVAPEGNPPTKKPGRVKAPKGKTSKKPVAKPKARTKAAKKAAAKPKAKAKAKSARR